MIPLAAAFSGAFWGFVADKIRNRKIMALILPFIRTTITLFLAFSFISDHGFYPIFFVSFLSTLFTFPGVLDSYALDFLGKKHSKRYG